MDLLLSAPSEVHCQNAIVANSVTERDVQRHHAHTMFVRFRKAARRLQVSLVEARRKGRKVEHEHVASLGSLPAEATARDRIKFWSHLHERMAKLSNRIDVTTVAKLTMAIHARVPMPTVEDRWSLQLEAAKHDAELWETLRGAQMAEAEGHRVLIRDAQRKIAESEAKATDAARQRDAARERIARLEGGEDVGGGRDDPMTVKEMLGALGWTEAYARHTGRVAEIGDLGAFEEYVAEVMKGHLRSERATARHVLKRHRDRP